MRMGWLGWSSTLLAIAVAAFAAFAAWAATTGSVASLDGFDALFPRSRSALLAEAARYGADPHQKYELFVPAGAPPAGGFPLVAFYHGGGWHSGDPHDYRFVARTLAARGYATALIGYRLSAAGRYPAMLQDSAAGLAAALDGAARHGIDTARVALVGHSAGAYNAAMLALDPRWLAAVKVDRRRIAGVAGLSGPYDFFPFKWKSSRDSFGAWPRPEETQPLHHVAPAAPPMLLLTGTADKTVAPRNTRVLARALREVGNRIETVEVADMAHSGPVVTLARPFDRDPRVANALFAFLARVLAPVPASSPVQPATL